MVSAGISSNWHFSDELPTLAIEKFHVLAISIAVFVSFLFLHLCAANANIDDAFFHRGAAGMIGDYAVNAQKARPGQQARFHEHHSFARGVARLKVGPDQDVGSPRHLGWAFDFSWPPHTATAPHLAGIRRRCKGRAAAAAADSVRSQPGRLPRAWRCPAWKTTALPPAAYRQDNFRLIRREDCDIGKLVAGRPRQHRSVGGRINQIIPKRRMLEQHHRHRRHLGKAFLHAEDLDRRTREIGRRIVYARANAIDDAMPMQHAGEIGRFMQRSRICCNVRFSFARSVAYS